jgi:hypothetical protein
MIGILKAVIMAAKKPVQIPCGLVALFVVQNVLVLIAAYPFWWMK